MSTVFVSVKIEHDFETGEFNARVERRHEGEDPSDAQAELAARLELAARAEISRFISTHQAPSPDGNVIWH